tara:strand:- start:20 stop:685 length:666 start_codon:yes stop_codon:yes gene_type:complete
MSEVTIRNKELLETLNGFSDRFFAEKDYNNPDAHIYSSEEDKSNGEYFCSQEYLDECLSRDKLVGVPDRHFAQPISKMVRVDPKWKDYMQRVKYDFASEIGAHTSALLSYYPKGGFVGWHTNYDASAYQVLFTWSTGKGFFRYLDNETGKLVTHQDVAGWQCRHYYFGSEKEKEHHCWHSAYAGDDRITLAYKFCGYGKNDPRDQQARDLRDLLIEDIETL